MGMEYDDGNVEIVILGGTNKTTGKKNPTELTGYYLRQDEIKTKFGTKPLYVFRTQSGDRGIIGGGNLNKIMETKVVGLLTHVIDTGTTKDVGKGNEMKVYKVGQDKGDSLDIPMSTLDASTHGYDEDEETPDDDTTPADEVAYTPPKAPSRPVTTSSAAQLANLLKSRQKTA